jgi:hypothetical protein
MRELAAMRDKQRGKQCEAGVNGSNLQRQLAHSIVVVLLSIFTSALISKQ